MRHHYIKFKGTFCDYCHKPIPVHAGAWDIGTYTVHNKCKVHFIKQLYKQLKGPGPFKNPPVQIQVKRAGRHPAMVAYEYALKLHKYFKSNGIPRAALQMIPADYRTLVEKVLKYNGVTLHNPYRGRRRARRSRRR